MRFTNGWRLWVKWGAKNWGKASASLGVASCQVLITENDMFNKSKFLNSKVQMFCSKRCFRIGFSNDTWMILRAVRHISGFRFLKRLRRGACGSAVPSSRSHIGRPQATVLKSIPQDSQVIS